MTCAHVEVVYKGCVFFAVHGMLPGSLESKTTYQFPTFYPPPPATATATATAPTPAIPPPMQVTPTSSYLPAPSATGGLIPLPLFNRGPVAPAPFPNGIPNPPTPAALYTLYPSHTSGQCSCRYCTNATTSPSMAAALPSHPLGTLPVLSAGLNSSLAPAGVLKYEKEIPPRFTPLTHITEVIPLPQPILSTGSSATQPSTFTTTVTVPSPQPQPQEAQTPPMSESMTQAASQPSPSCSSVRSVTPLEQQQQQAAAFPNTSPCPTLPTSSESASIASGYAEHDVCESVITATVPDQELCAMMYESRRGMKPLFHLPTTCANLEPLTTSSSAPLPPMTNGTTSQGNAQQLPSHQWMWNNVDTATTQPLYETELPEIPETPSDSKPTEEDSIL